MKKFENLTKNSKEKAIKVGRTVPSDAANLSFYSNEELTPANNLSIIDVSQSIPENKASQNSGVKTFFANELGILEDENGSTLFPTSNITVSDTILGKDYVTEELNEFDINSLEFFHHYYVSRFFTAAPSGFSIAEIDDYLSPSYIRFLNIKVIDSNNQEYVDINTGRKKYKILLDPYLTEQNSQEADVPYKIIVGLDATSPVGLKLVYDKVECDSNGKIINQNLRYSETINARPYFKLLPEESFVVDNSYRKKVFSVKKYNKKYSDVFTNYSTSTGYSVYVPKKALADNRTFEVFNWRLIARSKQSLNLELVDYFASLEETTGIKQKTIQAAVLYDSTDTTSLDNIKPYIFYRLQNSPFNFSKFSFSNPLRENQEKNQASYWMVDINSVDTLEDFDIVAFRPTKKLSERATSIISNYVKIQNGTILVDGSNYPSNEPFISSDLFLNTLNTANVPAYYEYNTSSKILDESKNGGWNIDQSIFENEDFGIFGLKKPAYRYINSTIPKSKSLINIGESSSSSDSVGVLLEFSSSGDSVSQGNIIFTSFSFFEYCNSIYSISSKATVLDANNGPIAVDEADTGLLASVVEGPFKLLYNCVSYAMYSRAYAGTVLDTRSSLFNFVGQWNSSWAMNQDALLDQEKELYFKNIIIDSLNSRQARDLTELYSSVEDYYLKNIYNNLPSYHRDKITYIDLSQVEFFLEITNPDIIIHNSVKVSNQEEAVELYNIPTSYYLHKLNNSKQKAYAYTDTISPKINIPDGFGPYVVREVPSIKSSDIKTINNQIDPINYFQSYPFELESAYSYQTATDKPLNFSGNYTANLRIRYQGTGELAVKKPVGTVVRNFERTVPRGGSVNQPSSVLVPGAIVPNLNCINIKSILDLFAPQGPISASNGYQWRAFDYTGDIDAGNIASTYSQGSSGEYVKYIQSALKAGNFYSATIDGSFGPATKAAVTAFQNFMKAYRPVYSVDGTVDSETKALIAFAIKNKLRGMDRSRNAGSPKFYDATIQQGSVSGINSGVPHRKISYSGSGLGTTVTQIQDVIFFTVPSGGESVDSVTINFGSNANWRKLNVVSYGFSSVDHSSSIRSVQDVFSSYKVVTINAAPDASGNVVLKVDQPMSNAKYMYIHIRTRAETISAKYGNAEGYNISSIRCSIRGQGTSAPDEIESAQETYLAFPSLVKPEIDEIANYYLQGTSSLFYENGFVKSTQNGFLLYTFDDDEYWQWNGSSWENIEPGENVTKNIVDRSETLTFTVDAVASVVDSGKFDQLNSSISFPVQYDTQTIKSKNLFFSSLSYSYLGKTYQDVLGTSYSLSSGDYNAASGVRFDLGSPIYVDLTGQSAVSLSQVKTESGSDFSESSSAISIIYSNSPNPLSPNPTKFTLETSAVYYSGSNLITTDPVILNNYQMMTTSKNIVSKKESVTVLDGLLLLCTDKGRPFGIPTGSEISSYFGSSILDEEKDSRFGFVFVKNRLENKEGFVFGFYDIAQKEFLGDKISYVSILSRGIQNVYIAVCAFDADGNTLNQVDYIGPKVSTTFIPVDVPIKKICPVYSVKFNSLSAIQIGNIYSFIDKKEAWPLPITSGSFEKEIYIPRNSFFTDWKSNYLGQKLYATYDTTSSLGVNWSNIFGRGYYDIKNEKPIIISDKQIKLRQAPFLVWPEPTNYQQSKVELFRPQFEIYTRQNLQSEWTKLDFSQVRDYDSNTGVIEFNSKVVPLDENLIKVNYIKVSSDLVVYQSNGNPVPLNPFLNSDSINLNKPLYIYIVPNKVFKLSDLKDSYEWIPVSEYSESYPFNFTYDSSIFDSNSVNYDPFALVIGIIYFINNPNKKQTQISDTRLRGGGTKAEYGVLELEGDIVDLLSLWDTYPAYGTSYPKGGFVIIRLPEEVKNNFQDIEEIYDIIRRNLTAGVSFQIQNLNGEPWEI
jgi:peptidoglycan hydrolase-like protein with peptidoglycan-binding domain